ncbi:fatty acid synthase [Tribolium castaneum]|uniref:Fatty acid synthase-like Protein n=1 Tax=Tribolium castaneum TaxID=7070 RepID=D2A4M4_TRICA|nr:PREDICTED: fatty acid synthase [Tribolium castaneum]EFA05204.2 Fatty acid synthase-like Protein [Tribolium castaneum]|eukprot:XP_008194480.2 PREDICTED: fatty acid synthase [Tribolium castaneum]
MQDENFEFGRWLSTPPPGDEVVITGISGQFPKSGNVKQFRDNLFNKQSMLSKIEERWLEKHTEIPPTGGFLPDITKLDLGFFGIHWRQCQTMDPTVRGFLEVSLEAILDAGVHPEELKGSKTGVFVGYSWSDVEWASLRSIDEPQTFGITGYERSFIPRRVSYFLKLKGPSYVVDTACSSSLNALDHAFKAIRSGQCDNALVGGCNLTLNTNTTLQFARFGVLSKEGRCKVFDQDADGYVRSETIACIFLQKARSARRIYAKIIHSKSNHDGFKNDGLFFPSSEMQSKLLQEIYNESTIDPSRLIYMELHGTGTKVGDSEEIQAVDKAICAKRTQPLYIGGVKSNIGHAEPASGMAAIIKVLLAMEEATLIPNINLKKVKTGMVALETGRMKVVTEVTPYQSNDTIMGVSNFGFGGTNCHVILERVAKLKQQFDDNIPRLVCVSGRTEESVQTILKNLVPLNYDFVALLHQIFKKPFNNHLYRGYSIVTKNDTVVTSIRKNLEQKTQFVVNFGRFGKSYQMVGRYFLQFPVFQQAMHRINIILNEYNLNIIDLIQKSGIQTNLGGIAVQIGIVDVLKNLRLDPIMSFTDLASKLVSDYHEGHLTLKEVLLESLNYNYNETVLTNPKKTRHQTNPSKLNPPPPNSTILDLSDSNPNIQDQFLPILGQLFQQGYHPHLDQLYPNLPFPVGRNTPMVAPLVQWDHSKSWKVDPFVKLAQWSNMEYDVRLAEDNLYLGGHVIDGRNLFPATGYLTIVWELIAKERNIIPIYLPIVFENCKFVRATTIPKTGFVTFSVSLQKVSGEFEITENDSVVVTGRVSTPTHLNFAKLPDLELKTEVTETLDESEIYKELHLRGYNYTGCFKGIVKCNIDASVGLIRWENNFVSFMDKMLQLKLLELDSRLLFVPIGIKKILIDPRKHLEEQETVMKVSSYRHCNVLKCGGIEISGLYARPISRRKVTLEPVLETNIFVPNDFTTDLSQSVRINTQIILEESLDINFKALEIHDEFSPPDTFIMPLVFNALEDVPLVQPDLTISTKSPVQESPGVKITSDGLTPSNFLLIVGSKLLQRASFLNQILASLSPHGFVLSREDLSYVPENSTKISILTQHCIGNEKLILFRKFESNERLVVELSSSQWMSQLKQALKTKNETLVVSQKNQIEGILGFVNCVRREPDGRKIRCVFIMDQAPAFDPKNTFYSQQIDKNMVFNVYKNGSWGTYRHLRLIETIKQSSEHSFVTCLSRGDLSSLKWVQGPLSRQKTSQNLVTTSYCAINFKDIMTASGRITLTMDRISQENMEGFEFSGVDSKGNRVMGMVSNGALSTLIDPVPHLTWMVPPEWSLEEAATVPVVYSTVIYGLLMRSSLSAGTSILIHSGTGGVGLAAINVALAHKCTVFVTVGTKEKRDFLKKNFPEINESHIGNSRDVSFKELILKETQGRGVDIVLNSLVEEKLKTSIQCLARGGKFMEIGKFDLVNNNSLQLLLLEKEASYHGIMLDSLFNGPVDVKLTLNDMVCEGVKKGYVKPLPRTVFESANVEGAFRYMTTGKHIGKVLLKIREDNHKEASIQCLPKFWADPSKCYIILGGLGGFGLELADWLVLRGARNLVLTSRTGVQTGYQTQRIKIWQSYGARVNISTITISSKDDCVKLIQEATKLAPVDAIFNLAVVLKDELFENQTEENFRISLTPKAFATKYLDQVSRDLCPNLRFFVVFSSVSCGRGNIGQSNYGMANSIMERVCEKRKSEGFPALAIQWGAIGDVGLVAKMQKDNKELVIGGTLQQKISSCLNVMDRFLNQDNPVVSSMVVAEKRDKRIGGENPVDAVCAILGIKDIKTVNQQSNLTELGMDSILGNEILQTLEKDFDIFIPPKELRNMTFAKLLDLQNQKNSKTQTEKMEQGTKALIQLVPDSSSDDKPFIKLKSLANQNEDAPTIFVLPGIEGVVQLIETLSQKLKAHVYGLQYSFKNPENTVQEIAKNILPHVKTLLQDRKNFTLIAYSFGVLVAFELAVLLESEDCFGTIFAIDGAPKYLKASILQHLSGSTEGEFETFIIYSVLAHFLPIEFLDKNRDKLLNCTNFAERIETAASLVPPELLNKEKMDKQALITFHRRYKAVREYQTQAKIKSVIRLYKPEVPVVGNMQEDYNLSEVCEKVEVINLKGNHFTIVEQDGLADDITKVLGL